MFVAWGTSLTIPGTNRAIMTIERAESGEMIDRRIRVLVRAARRSRAMYIRDAFILSLLTILGPAGDTRPLMLECRCHRYI